MGNELESSEEDGPLLCHVLTCDRTEENVPEKEREREREAKRQIEKKQQVAETEGEVGVGALFPRPSLILR